MKNLAGIGTGFGAGFVLGSYPILGHAYQQNPQQEAATPYGIPLPPSEGFVEFNGYNYMEKHNWALDAFLKDALDGKIPLKQNTMFHIDTHHDACCQPVIKITKNFTDLLQKAASYDEAAGLIKYETRITNTGSWIIKAFAAGLTDEVYWVRPRWDFRNRSQPPVTYYALEEPRPGTPYTRIHKTSKKSDMDGVKKFLTVHEISADEILQHMGRLESFLYDVDLDYFSCSAQGAPEWVSAQALENLQEGFVKWCKWKYGERFEIKGDLARNPLRTVYKAPLPEIEREMSVIKAIEDALPRDRPFSKTLSVSPDFLFEDQREYIVNNFFQPNLAAASKK